MSAPNGEKLREAMGTKARLVILRQSAHTNELSYEDATLADLDQIAAAYDRIRTAVVQVKP